MILHGFPPLLQSAAAILSSGALAQDAEEEDISGDVAGVDA